MYKRQLFDLTKDIGETTDVAAEHPDVVKQLSTQLAQARDLSLIHISEPTRPY